MASVVGDVTATALEVCRGQAAALCRVGERMIDSTQEVKHETREGR